MAESSGGRDAPTTQARSPSARVLELPARFHPPRVIVTPVDPPLHHPLAKRDVQLVLSVLPRESTSGLRSVSLLGERQRADGTPVLASYRHAGFLRLHAVSSLPWICPELSATAAAELRLYGALIEPLPNDGSRVVWPGDSLRLYFTLGVLLPGVARHHRERDGENEVETDVRWVGAHMQPWWVSEEAMRQWSALLRGRTAI